MPAARFACLPWYDLPETRAAQDALWTVIARHLRHQGIDGVPSRLTRGRPVPALLSDPDLLFGQCCGYDVVYGFSDSLTVLATPEYDAAGCAGSDYRSFVLVRADSPVQSLNDLCGATCVVNGFNSHSGTNALRALVAPLSRNGRFFASVKVSGAHTQSLALLLAGEADVMAMDCVVHALLARHRPEALSGTRILCPSDPAPAPPFVTALAAAPTDVARHAEGARRRPFRRRCRRAAGNAAAARHRVPAGDGLCKDRRFRGRSACPRLYGTARNQPRAGAVNC